MFQGYVGVFLEPAVQGTIFNGPAVPKIPFSSSEEELRNQIG